MEEKLLELKNITKTFPGVIALDNVNFEVYKGKIMALAGENGAGKSTLMKIISGIYIKDSGSIYYEGKKVEFKDIQQTIDLGIGIIHQELNLLPELTVLENIFLGREKVNKFGKIDYASMEKEVLEIFSKLGIDYNIHKKVKEFSIAEQQMIEISKVLSQNAKLIIMDEPTDALSDKEIEKLFKVTLELKNQGKGIVYISHRLNEIFEICDDVTIFRDGKYICSKKVSEIDEKKLIEYMVGRKIEDYFPYEKVVSDEVVLEVFNLNNEYVKNISFNLKRGEVLGISGLVGSGRTELCKTIFGALKKETGQIKLNGKNIKINSIEDALNNKIYYVSEDRKKDGLVLGMSIKDNMSLSSIKDFENSYLKIDSNKEIAAVDKYVVKFMIKAPNIRALIKNLSGGNQQKVSIAKALMTNPKVLILDEPTRGIDVGAKRDIYLLINELKKNGIAVILVSSEMPEILGLSDRILVMSNKRITKEFSKEDATQEKIMAASII